MRKLLILMDHIVIKGARLINSLKNKSNQLFFRNKFKELSDDDFAYEQERAVLPEEYYSKRSISSMRKPFKNNRKYNWNKAKKL